jgi:thiamine biosynthesis lipoprotein ApbE
MRKGDHILDPRTGQPARGRLAAWVAVPRPEAARAGARGPQECRVAPAAVADALTTAFMLLEAGEIAAICDASPGLEAWISEDAGAGAENGASLLHAGGPGADSSTRPTGG